MEGFTNAEQKRYGETERQKSVQMSLRPIVEIICISRQVEETNTIVCIESSIMTAHRQITLFIIRYKRRMSI